MSAERYVTDHEWGVAVEIGAQESHYLTPTEALELSDELLAAVSNAPDLCICRHRYASHGDLCGACSEAHEPKPDVA